MLIQDRCQFEDHCPAFHRFFDKEKYLYEFDFHVKNQLLSKYFKLNLNKKEQKDFRDFSVEISQTLDISEQLFVHRDFQSSNIFYDEAKKSSPFKIIDFQDARSGSSIYDLVSCLWDSYITIPEDLRNQLLEKYFEYLRKRGTSLTKNDFQKLVDFTVIQRKLHDAGAFAYNYHRFNEEKFTSFISPAIQMAVEKMKLYNSFQNVIKIFEKTGEQKRD
jgi:aminoglycoside/choline kinase family phosphotransferase